MTYRNRIHPQAHPQPKPLHAERPDDGAAAVVSVVPHVDEVAETAPPWTTPHVVDEGAAPPELVAPMKDPCRLADVSGTSAPRFVPKPRLEISGVETDPPGRPAA
jgi:hypothetical protein